MNASFDHLKSILQYPGGAAAAQDTFDRKRLADVEKAVRTRPQFLPIQHTLPAAAQGAAISETTDPLTNADVIVHGAITDGGDDANGDRRNCRFYRDTEALPLVRYGSEAGVNLSLDAIAGHNIASAGLPGIMRYPEPFLVRRTRVLTLDIFQEAAPGLAEIVTTCFVGERVMNPSSDDAKLTDAQRRNVIDNIKLRSAPEPRWEVFPVAFDADGFATAETPKADEPQLLRGFRSTFTDALVNFGYDDGTSFSKSRFPIWALCNEPNNGRAVYLMLKTPLFIEPSTQLPFVFTNTVDGVLFATDGNVEMLLTTV